MIGERYLGYCGVLRTALAEMESMARSLDLGMIITEPARELAQTSFEPFLVVITGADGSGKSALVNAFARAKVANDSPAPHRTVYEYTHGAQPAESQLSINTIRRARPVAGLEKLRVVEMPLREDARSLFNEEIMPAADAVLFVLPITSPWSEPVWDFLKGIHFPVADRLICVLQQSDLRSPLEVEAVTRHIGQTMRDRFGETGSVQPVSALLAMEAQAGPMEDPALLERSGFRALERRISEIIAHSEPRLRRFREKVEQARRLLDDMASRILSRCHTLQRDLQRLGTLGRSVAGGKADMVQHLTGALLSLARECDHRQMESYRALDRNLSPLALFVMIFRPVTRRLEKEVGEHPMRDTIRHEVPHAIQGLQAAFREVWEHFHQTLQRDFSTRLPPAPAEPPPTKTPAAILEQIEREAFADVSPVMDEEEIFPAIHALAGRLRLFAVLIAITAGAAGFFASSKPVWAATAGGLTLGLLLVAIGLAARERAKLVARYRQQLFARREAAIAATERQLHEVVEQFYRDMGATFEPLEGFCNARMHFFDPFLHQIGNLGTRLETLSKTVGAELRD